MSRFLLVLVDGGECPREQIGARRQQAVTSLGSVDAPEHPGERRQLGHLGATVGTGGEVLLDLGALGGIETADEIGAEVGSLAPVPHHATPISSSTSRKARRA